MRAEPDGDAPDEVNFHSNVKKSIEETIWIAASPWNIFKNVILQSGSNVNGGVHRDMCLIGEFLPFIGEKYPNSGYLIRTEPTVAYYARDAVHFLEEADLVTLKRDDTPPKLSQNRPIRDFSGVLKQDLYRGG